MLSAGVTERDFEEKTRQEGHQGYFVLTGQCPRSPVTFKPEETGLPGLPFSWSPTLFSGSGPIGLPPVPWNEETIKTRHFLPTRRSLLPRRPGWTDNLLNFLFECLAKVRATD